MLAERPVTLNLKFSNYRNLLNHGKTRSQGLPLALSSVPMKESSKDDASVAVGVTPRIPSHLDEKAQGEIRDAQDVMRRLIQAIPRHFSHDEEIALDFLPRRGV